MRVHMKDTLEIMPSIRHQEGRRTDGQTDTQGFKTTRSSSNVKITVIHTALKLHMHRQTDTHTDPQKYTHRHTQLEHTLKTTR